MSSHPHSEGIFYLEDVNSPPNSPPPPHRTLSSGSLLEKTNNNDSLGCGDNDSNDHGNTNTGGSSSSNSNSNSNSDDNIKNRAGHPGRSEFGVSPKDVGYGSGPGPGSGARTTSSGSPISSPPGTLPAGLPLPQSAAGDILSSIGPGNNTSSGKNNSGNLVGLPSSSSSNQSSTVASGSTLGITGLPPTFTGMRKINQPNASSPLAKWQVQPHSDDSDKSSTGGSQPGSPEQMSGMESGRERSESTSTLGEGSGLGSGLGFGTGFGFGMSTGTSAGNVLNVNGMSPVLAMTPGNHLLLQQQRKKRSTSQSSGGTGGGGSGSGNAGSRNNTLESSGTSSGSSPRQSPRSSPKRSPVQLDPTTRETLLTTQAHARARSDSVNSISSQYEQGGRGRSDSGGSVGREGMSSSLLSRSGLLLDGRRRVGDGDGAVRERGETMPGSVLGLGVKTTSPRMRRRSELPTDRDRRMSVSSRGLSSPLAMPIRVSDAVSTISPLNPLPSPWTSLPGPELGVSPRTNGSIDSTTSSASGSIKLTRVPTSVRLAQDLLKTAPPASASPEAMTGFNTPAIDLGDLLDPSAEAFATKIPATPSATRNVTPDEASSTIQEEPEPETIPQPEIITATGSTRKSSVGDDSLPPSPTRLKRNAPRQRPSLPPPSAFAMPTTAPNVPPNTAQPPKRPTMAPALSGFPGFREPLGTSTSMTFLSPPIRAGHHARNRSTSNETATKPSMKSRMMSMGGVPLEAMVQDTSSMATSTSSDRHTSILGSSMGNGQDAEGDASRHANVIMQSRRAKIQRWRPGSSGTDGGTPTETPIVKPAFGRGITSQGISMGNRDDTRQFRRVVSGQDHSEPTVFPLEVDAAAAESLPRTDALHSQSQRPTAASRHDSFGDEGIANDTINEIEWVDWMDEYKRYKEAKIRAEQAEQPEGESVKFVESEQPEVKSANASSVQEMPPIQTSEGGSPSSDSPSASHTSVPPPGSTSARSTERPTYSPRKSEDGRNNATGRNALARTLSLTYSAKSSTSSAIDTKASSHRGDFGIISRHPSMHSARSLVFSGKKKKNIAAKMEGWWSAVKSNFGNQPEGSSLSNTDRYGSESPRRHAPTPRKLPSAPSSRRGSTAPVDSPSLPSKRESAVADRSPSHQLLRAATSHTSLQQLEQESIAASTPDTAPKPDGKDVSCSAGAAQDESSSDVQGALPVSVGRPLPVSRLSSDHQSTFVKAPAPSSLEARRRQPPLSLKLENNVLIPPRLHGRQNSNLSSGASTSNSSGRAAFASHGRQESHMSSGVFSTGVHTPSFHHWDQTPSPLMSLNATRPEATYAEQELGSSMTGPNNTEFTLASVRRHVRHRLTVAKEGCDRELRFIVSDITAFVEEHLHLPPAVAESEADAEEVLQDVRSSSYGLSPRTAYSDLEDEAELMDREIVAAMMIPQSAHARRSSISLSAATSPIKRREIANLVAARDDPASPGRRRRSSALSAKNARSVELGQRLGRVLATTADRSAASSRSNSRSRSPMPQAGFLSGPFVNTVDDGTNTKLVDALQKIIGIATDVTETDVDVLIAKPAACRDFISRVWEVGQIWDKDPEADGRSWYIRLLLAVAGLTRVVEWWEAEKGFWNFDGDGDNEPLTFVLKPVREGDPVGTPPVFARLTSEAGSGIGTPGTVSSMSDQLEASPELNLDPVLRDSQVTARPSDVPVQLQAVQDLQLQAEHNKSINIVLELSLGGELIEWVNPAWHEITGSDPTDAENTPITAWLAPADVDVLANAGRQLEADDSHTAQARFRLLRLMQTDDEDVSRLPGPTYIECEGIGMLMRDRDTGEASHTMWVIKPVVVSQTMDTPSDIGAPTPALDSGEDLLFPTIATMSAANVLCRICERQVPTWFFEKHNETCNEVHRLEADISAVNEKVAETITVVTKILKSLENGAPDQPAQYQGMIISTRTKSIPHHAMGPVMLAVRRIQQSQLENAHTALGLANAISTPSVKDEDSSNSISYQQLLSPASEDRLTFIGRWVKPETDDPALQMLFIHVDELIRRKQMTVNRMRNTIMYAERVRREWEDKMDRMLSIAEEEGSTSDHSSNADSQEATALQDQTPENALSISPSTAKRRVIDPKARLPPTTTTMQRQQSTHTVATVNGIAAADDRLPIPSPPIIKPPKRMSNSRRSSANRAPMEAPMSPRLPSVASMARTAPTSIKDFDIIKPISRGAFGSVYLAKKRTTGDYFAIKALKKSDMIAKNQITNVKAERTILMNQASSPYVAKLYFSFQNKDYLYLVMEYLNGGDCAALIKTLGGLPEEWARNYIAEVVLGLEYLHDRGIVHRDLKPDNLLIDSKGHLKLTDFGLSRIGLLNRQVGGPRPAVLRGTSLKKMRGLIRTGSPRAAALLSETPLTTPDFLLPPTSSNLSQSYFSSHLTDGGSADESSGSESFSGAYSRSRDQGRAASARNSGTHKPSDVPKFVGTPDYLCPESILGIGSDAPTVDWWAVGVVLYEFIYGFPPFHDETPEKVFDNIVSRRINWFEDQMELSSEARDLMERLMCTDPGRRLGAQGACEVKCHPFFTGIDWHTIATVEANFVPNVTDPESTDYFDARGATSEVFFEDDAQSIEKAATKEISSKPTGQQASGLDQPIDIDSLAPPGDAGEDFGTFTYKNLPVLKQANDEVIKKLRRESMIASEQLGPHDRRLSLALDRKRTKNRASSVAEYCLPPSPTASTSSSASRASAMPQTPSSSGQTTQVRRVSDQHPLNKVHIASGLDLDDKCSGTDSGTSFSYAPPGLMDKARSVSGQSGDSALNQRRTSEATSLTGSRAVDVLIAEDNPISQKILETLLTRMGCRCVCVNDGAEALAASMGTIRFDIIITDLVMPNVTGEEVARMIRSTSNPNFDTPIIAATSYEHKQLAAVTAQNTADPGGVGSLFSAVLAKPITKRDLTDCLAKLGFRLGTSQTAEGKPTKRLEGPSIRLGAPIAI